MDREKIAFTHDGPYPPIEIRCRNSVYGRQMLDNMGGCNSEMSAISLYFYNNLVTEPKFADIAWIFHKISIVEMHHMEIFGKLAMYLGEEPRLWTCREEEKVYWSPSCNKYPWELRGLMHNALEGELNTIEKYKDQIKCIDDPCIVANLERIILDEEVHVAIFKMIIEEYHLKDRPPLC